MPHTAHLGTLVGLPLAASVLIFRQLPGRALEVLIVERSPKARFMSGFLAFPGGRHEAVDGPPQDDDTPRATAVRETFEEVGLRLDERRLGPVGTWRTPDYLVMPMRTHFFSVVLDETESDGEPVADGEEIVAAAFRPPAAVLADWDAGRCLLAPPTRFLLECAAAGLDGLAERALAAPESHGQPPRFARVRPDIELLALRTPTLPPATHTNCYVVGRERLVVIDPATPEPAEQALLLAHLDARVAGGEVIEAVALTHAHHDHIAAAPVVAARFGVPILAHPDAVAGLPFAAVGALADLQRLTVGDTPLIALHTPGHAPGHIVFWHEATRTAVAGDLVAGVGTILVDPDAGSMADYLATLARVRALSPRALLPAHGGVIGGAVEKLTEYIEHRLWRERRVATALDAGEADLDALVARVYEDVSPTIWPLAELSLRAHLYKLRDEGRARSTDARGRRWAPVTEPA